MAWEDKYDKHVLGAPLVFCAPGSSSANQWFGTTGITSQIQVVSTAMTGTGSKIYATLEWLGPVSSAAIGFGVTSKSSAGFFFVTNSINFASGGVASVQANWFVVVASAS